MGGAKTAGAEKEAETSTGTGSGRAAAGRVTAVNINGKHVASVSVTNGVITATMRAAPAASAKVGGSTLVLTPSDAGGSIKWTCNAGTITDKFLPANCR